MYTLIILQAKDLVEEWLEEGVYDILQCHGLWKARVITPEVSIYSSHG